MFHCQFLKFQEKKITKNFEIFANFFGYSPKVIKVEFGERERERERVSFDALCILADVTTGVAYDIKNVSAGNRNCFNC